LIQNITKFISTFFSSLSYLCVSKLANDVNKINLKFKLLRNLHQNDILSLDGKNFPRTSPLIWTNILKQTNINEKVCILQVWYFLVCWNHIVLSNFMLKMPSHWTMLAMMYCDFITFDVIWLWNKNSILPLKNMI
jgi:hypothetical protein